MSEGLARHPDGGKEIYTKQTETNREIREKQYISAVSVIRNNSPASATQEDTSGKSPFTVNQELI